VDKYGNQGVKEDGKIMEYLSLGVSLVMSLLALAVMLGKHTESVKNQHSKNIEQDARSDKQDSRSDKQDAKIEALHVLITAREDILRSHIDSRFTHLDSKVDAILTKLS